MFPSPTTTKLHYSFAIHRFSANPTSHKYTILWVYPPHPKSQRLLKMSCHRGILVVTGILGRGVDPNYSVLYV